MSKLKENQKKLLYLISEYTKKSKNLWLREEALIGLVYYFIKLGIFKKPYNYVPTPYLWEGKFKYINYSHEAMYDLEILLNKNLCYEVIVPKEDTNYFIKGYRINDQIELNLEYPEIKREIYDKEDKLKKIRIVDKGIILGNKFIDLTKGESLKYVVDIDEIQ